MSRQPSRRYVMALTYQPKIEGVLSGEIRQTIRPFNSRLMRTRSLLLHGWEGKPYRSPWSWRINAEVQRAEVIDLASWGVAWAGEPFGHFWRSPRVSRLAVLDGVPSGEELMAVLEGIRGRPFTLTPESYIVLTWAAPAWRDMAPLEPRDAHD